VTDETKKFREDQSARSLAELLLLRDRLKQEGELELLNRIRICQEPIILKCLTCKARREVKQRCKRRWCPCCARQLAADRATMLEYIVERMRWPLFVTLTMRHSSIVSAADVRTLRIAFGKFRRHKLWSTRTRGGVASVELTNDAGGWHPHLHSVCDCQWMAVGTPPPRPRATPEEWKTACTSAAKEMGNAWAKLLGQDEASVRIKRCARATIAKEVTKYTVKNQDLVQAVGSTGDIIRSIDRTRAFTTFGTAHGQKTAEIRKAAKAYAKAKRAAFFEENPTERCCGDPMMMPISELESGARRAATSAGIPWCQVWSD
jgi:hypothetical protein